MAKYPRVLIPSVLVHTPQKILILDWIPKLNEREIKYKMKNKLVTRIMKKEKCKRLKQKEINDQKKPNRKASNYIIDPEDSTRWLIA